MKRRNCEARPDWQARCESEGYRWHTEPTGRCWKDDTYYELTQDEAAGLKAAAEELHELLLRAAAEVVRRGWWDRVGIPERHVPLLKESFEQGEPLLCGRFDFLMDESGQPKLLEYNADGALTLLETAIIQRDWLRELMPGAGQFNELHHALVKAWKNSGHSRVHCAWRPRHPEIEGSIRYMAKVIREAGLSCHLEALHCIGWDKNRQRFVDRDGEDIRACYKLYPWAWMLEEPFREHLCASGCTFIEPAWSHLLVSKALLALLWELFPDHPAVLPCYLAETHRLDSFVSKPFFGREGHNITIYQKGRITAQTGGDFAQAACIHQQHVSSPRFDGFTPQFGVWMVKDQAVALGIRESQADIIDSNSAFVPHVIPAAGHVVKEVIA